MELKELMDRINLRIALTRADIENLIIPSDIKMERETSCINLAEDAFHVLDMDFGIVTGRLGLSPDQKNGSSWSWSKIE